MDEGADGSTSKPVTDEMTISTSIQSENVSSNKILLFLQKVTALKAFPQAGHRRSFTQRIPICMMT